MREPRTGKSFRAAGLRIVNQEAAASAVVTRLLGSPVRRAGQDGEAHEGGDWSDDQAWSVRLGALAALGQYDGLAIVGRPAGTSPGYNVVADPTAEPVVGAAVDDCIRGGVTAQLRASVVLADGRTAGALLIAPLQTVEGAGEGPRDAADDAPAGAVVALRVGRAFGAADAFAAVSIAELVGLELARSAAGRRMDTDRRQAIGLYEIARLALLADAADPLRDAVRIAGGPFEHDVAQLWLLRPRGSLELRATHPDAWAPREIARPLAHEALAAALVGGRPVRRDGATSACWAPPAAAHAIVAPLADDAGPLGLLVLGRFERPYGRADEALAAMLGSFVGQVVRSATGDRLGRWMPAAADALGAAASAD